MTGEEMAARWRQRADDFRMVLVVNPVSWLRRLLSWCERYEALVAKVDRKPDENITHKNLYVWGESGVGGNY
jgi:hypothetical protein